MTDFDASVVQDVVAHMNGDHLDDNLLIVRAQRAPEATAAAMKDVDAQAGTWEVMGPGGPLGELRVPWPGGPIGQRSATSWSSTTPRARSSAYRSARTAPSPATRLPTSASTLPQ